jgi:hypothetical protein
MTLFDARVRHLIRRGYSGQEEPGERYDMYVIDYGGYVDLIQTKYAPQGMLPLDSESGSGLSYTEVPTLDLRAYDGPSLTSIPPPPTPNRAQSARGATPVPTSRRKNRDYQGLFESWRPITTIAPKRIG